MVSKAVITGATGIIGSTLIDYLVQNQIEVLAICRPNSKKKDNIIKHPLVKIQYAELSTLKDISSRIKYDAYFHLGWEGTFGKSRNDMYLQNLNVKYTLDAVEMAHRLGCQSFIGAGSQAEYGRKQEKLSSATTVNPETGYGIAKYCAGKLSAIYAKQLGIKHVWARILSIYGPRDGNATMVMSAINKLLNNEIPSFTDGKQMWDYLYCTDAARALYLMAEQGKDQQVYCLGSGQCYPLKEYIYNIRDCINKQLELDIGKIPYSNNQVTYLCADTIELSQDTGFVPTVTFEQGIKHTIEYCKNNLARGNNT